VAVIGLQCYLYRESSFSGVTEQGIYLTSSSKQSAAKLDTFDKRSKIREKQQKCNVFQ
jgi:hypothetical protein